MKHWTEAIFCLNKAKEHMERATRLMEGDDAMLVALSHTIGVSYYQTAMDLAQNASAVGRQNDFRVAQASKMCTDLEVYGHRYTFWMERMKNAGNLPL